MKSTSRLSRKLRFDLQSGLRVNPTSLFKSNAYASAGKHDYVSMQRAHLEHFVRWLDYFHHPFENKQAVVTPDMKAYARNVEAYKTLNTYRINPVVGTTTPGALVLYWPSGARAGTRLAEWFDPNNTTFIPTVPLVTNAGTHTANSNYTGINLVSTMSSNITDTAITSGFGRTVRVSYRVTCYGQPDEVQGKMKVVYLDRRLNLANPALCYSNFFPRVGTQGLGPQAGFAPSDFRTEEFDLPWIYSQGGVHLNNFCHLDEDEVFLQGSDTESSGIYVVNERENADAAVADLVRALPNILIFFEGTNGSLSPIQIDQVTQYECIDHRGVSDSNRDVKVKGPPPKPLRTQSEKNHADYLDSHRNPGSRAVKSEAAHCGATFTQSAAKAVNETMSDIKAATQGVASAADAAKAAAAAVAAGKALYAAKNLKSVGSALSAGYDAVSAFASDAAAVGTAVGSIFAISKSDKISAASGPFHFLGSKKRSRSAAARLGASKRGRSKSKSKGRGGKQKKD